MKDLALGILTAIVALLISYVIRMKKETVNKNKSKENEEIDCSRSYQKKYLLTK